MTARFDLVCLGGDVLPAAQARVDPRDPAVTSGAALIETLAIAHGRLVWFDAHVARLHASEDAVGWPRTSASQLAAWSAALIAAAGARTAGLRVLRSPGPPDGPPTVLLELRPLPELPAGGVHLSVAAGAWATPSGFDVHKHAGRLARGVLRERARTESGAWEVLLVDEQGRLLEATAANVVVVDAAGRARTPPAVRGVLPGVARGHLLAAGLCTEAEVAAAELASAREVLVTNSLVRCLGARTVAHPGPGATRELPGPAGPLARRLRAALEAIQ